MAFHDAEQLVVDFYTALIEEHVGTFVPAERPRLFVRAWRTGGAARSRILDQPIISVQGWGTVPEDAPDASDLTNVCRDLMYGAGARLIGPCRGVREVTGKYWDPDPASAAPRYTFAAQLDLRAAF
jgi:hypothetical protein